MRAALVILALVSLLHPLAHELRAETEVTCSAALLPRIESILRLRDAGPDAAAADPADASASAGSPSDAEERARFGIAVILNDFIVRAKRDSASLPPGLRDFTPEELRKLRDQRDIDPRVCEIVEYMREFYSAPPQDEPATAASDRPAVASAAAPAAPAEPPAVARPLPPPLRPRPRRTTRSRRPASESDREPAAPKPAAPAAAIAVAATPAASSPTPGPVPSAAQASAERGPFFAAAQSESGGGAARRAEVGARTALGGGADPLAAAGETIRSIEQLLAAPRYMTRRDLSKNRSQIPDEELRQKRASAVKARGTLLVNLRVLANDPRRQAAVRMKLGSAGCARVADGIRRMFEGGPGAEQVGEALELWNTGPRP